MAKPSTVAVLLAAAALQLGCHSVSLYGNPFSDGPRSPPVAVYSVEWHQPLVPLRTLEIAPREAASPAIDVEGHRVIALTRDGWITALDETGEKTLWRVKTGFAFSAGALVHEGVVYVPGGDGVLYALDAATGKEKWRYAASEALATTPVLAEGKLFVVSVNDTLYAVNQADGKWLWQYRRDLPSGFTIRGASRPLVSFGNAFLGFSDGMFVSLKAEDGTVNWNRQLTADEGQFTDADASPVIDDAGRLYVASYRDGIFALNPDNGDLIWQTVTAGVTSLTMRGEVLFASGDQQVAAYLGETGKALWTLPLKGRAGSAPLLVRGNLIVPVDNELLFVDAGTGKAKIGWDPGEGVSAPPVWADSKLYVLSNTGVLYALRLGGRAG